MDWKSYSGEQRTVTELSEIDYRNITKVGSGQ